MDCFLSILVNAELLESNPMLFLVRTGKVIVGGSPFTIRSYISPTIRVHGLLLSLLLCGVVSSCITSKQGGLAARWRHGRLCHRLVRAGSSGVASDSSASIAQCPLLPSNFLEEFLVHLAGSYHILSSRGRTHRFPSNRLVRGHSGCR